MPKRFSAAFHAASHLALWAGLYFVGAVLCFFQTTSPSPTLDANDARILLYTFLAAAGVYLVDRVKYRNAWLDPADALAHPRRYYFLAARAAAVRLLAFVLITASGVIGWTVSPWLSLASLGACVGIFLYAGRPRRATPRVKDIIILKNSAVAGAITGFTLFLALTSEGPNASFTELWRSLTGNPRPFVLGGLLLFIRVFADAALCDIDDEHADRVHGTATLPTSLGRRRAWNIAMWMRLVVGFVLIVVPPGNAFYCRVWGVVTILGSLILRGWSPQKVRDAVDIRMPLEAAVVTLLAQLLA